jgi:hypothetical protein
MSTNSPTTEETDEKPGNGVLFGQPNLLIESESIHNSTIVGDFRTID